MNNLTIKQVGVILAHGLVGWALCGAVMGVGMALTSLDNATIIHALAAPLIFFIISRNYYTRFNYTSPVATAVLFLAVVVTMDFFLVALLINRSLEMFTSPLGTWIPFLLIFVSTYLTGLYLTRQGGKPAAA